MMNDFLKINKKEFFNFFFFWEKKRVNVYGQDFTAATDVFNNGKYSFKSDGVHRKLKDMATKKPSFPAIQYLMNVAELCYVMAGFSINSIAFNPEINCCPAISTSIILNGVVSPYVSYEYSDCEVGK